MDAKVATEAGFFIHEKVFAKEEVTSLFAAVSDVPHSRAGSRHLMSSPAVRVLASDRRLLQIAEIALTSTPIPFRATLFDKLPIANWKVAWHQDTALPLTKRIESAGWGPWSIKDGIHYAHAPTRALEQVVALRVHLDPSLAENGPLRVIPKTHQLAVLSDGEVATIAHGSKSVECLGGIGSVLMMRPMLIHASSKSESEIPRRVLHLEYASTLAIDEGMELAIA
jgi:ectoine hydroxylase-related dioxygenase (phytanoyl-CoA dioxygenase family)